MWLGALASPNSERSYFIVEIVTLFSVRKDVTGLISIGVFFTWMGHYLNERLTYRPVCQRVCDECLYVLICTHPTLVGYSHALP